MTTRDEPALYRIGFSGQLDMTWADWFDTPSLRVSYDQGASVTTLTGTIKDQSALHGLLARIRDLGLILLFIERVGPSNHKPVGRMEFSLLPASKQLKPVLENLMQLYLYEFTEYTYEDVDEQGCFIDEYLPRYWIEPERFPFLVAVDNKWAGFVLVRRISDPGDAAVTHSIAEFFIVNKYRRSGLGRQVAWQIFDRFPGRWVVEEMRENHPAQAFWRRIISEYTQGSYRETTRDDWDGPVQEFEKYTQPS